MIGIGSGVIRCRSCEEKFSKEKYDKAHTRNAVEQLIHTQIQRGYHLNIPVNRSLTNLRFVRRHRRHSTIFFLSLCNQSTNSASNLKRHTFVNHA